MQEIDHRLISRSLSEQAFLHGWRDSTGGVCGSDAGPIAPSKTTFRGLLALFRQDGGGLDSEIGGERSPGRTGLTGLTGFSLVSGKNTGNLGDMLNEHCRNPGAASLQAKP
jgi:hypothetical protein